MTHRQSRRGLTLVEILVVVTILGIFFSALLFFIFPSDERRCSLEAKRLAAYLTQAGAESAMRDGAARVVVDISASTAQREVTRIGAEMVRDVWKLHKKSEKHEVGVPVVIDSVDTPDVPNLAAGLGYVLFRNGKCPRGAVVVLRAGEVFYSVLVPSTGGEIRVERGKGKPPGQTGQPKRPSRKSRGSKGLTSKPPDYPTGSLGTPMPYTPKPPTTSGGRGGRSRGASSNSGKSTAKNTPSEPPEPYEPSTGSGVGTPQVGKPFEPQEGCTRDADCGPNSRCINTVCVPIIDEPEEEQGICAAGAVRCVGQSIMETCVGAGASARWGSRRECMFPQVCRGNAGCMDPNAASGEPTVMRLTRVDVQEPAAVKGLLQGLFNPVLQNESMIWLYYRKQGTGAQTLNYWLVQAQRDTEADQAQYTARAEVPTYRLEERSGCELENGRCFEAASERSTIKFYVPKGSPEDNKCAYLVIEVVNVTIDMDYNEAKMIVSGVVSKRSAQSLEVEGMTVYDKLVELEVEKDGDVNGDGVFDSWRIAFEGDTDAVPFVDDPAPYENEVPPNCL